MILGKSTIKRIVRENLEKYLTSKSENANKREHKDNIKDLLDFESVILEPDEEWPSYSLVNKNIISDQRGIAHDNQNNTRWVIETKNKFCINFWSNFDHNFYKSQVSKEKK